MSQLSERNAKHARRALPVLIMGAIAIGFSPVLVRLSELGPISTAFWRVALALIPLLLLSWRAHPGAPGQADAMTWGQRALAALPGVFLGAELAIWHISLHMTTVANATLLINMTPIPVALIGWLLFRTPISRLFLVGLVTSITGIVVLKGGPGSIQDGNLAGDIVALIGCVFYAGYFLTLSRIRDRFSTMTIMKWSTLSAGLAVLPFAIVLEPDFLPVTLAGWAVLLALAWVCHFAGQSFITFALAWLPPAFSSLTLLIQPIIASVMAWYLLDEVLTATQALGGAIVLLGILIARRG